MSRNSAHRMALHRKRKQRELKCVTLEIRSTEVAELIRRGLLNDAAHADRNALRDALYAHLDKTLIRPG